MTGEGNVDMEASGFTFTKKAIDCLRSVTDGTYDNIKKKYLGCMTLDDEKKL
jgi:hypothetical protein